MPATADPHEPAEPTEPADATDPHAAHQERDRRVAADQQDQHDRSGPPSLPLRVVVVVVGLEALLLVAVALFLLGEVVLADAADAVAATVTVAVALLFGGFLGVCARALWHRQRWARGPVVCWQLLQLLTAATTSFSHRWWVPALLVTASLVVGVGLFLPRVTAETTASADPPVL